MRIRKAVPSFTSGVVTKILAIVAVFSLCGPAYALCSSEGLALMKRLNGKWQGRGAVTPISGAPERVSCRVSYASEGPSRLRQVVACTGADYKLEAISRVTCNGNVLEGMFEEKIAHNTGTVRGTISGNHLTIDADGPTFKGKFRVVFHSETKHTVSITQFDPAKGRHVPVASIQLSR